MRPRLVDTPAPHGALGLGIALVVFGLAGSMILGAAIVSGWLPGWLEASGTGGVALRWLVGALGVALLAIGFGFLHFRRWAWWGGLAWAAWSAMEVVRGLDPGALITGIPLPQLLAACALPYLWARRHDFGVGGRGPHRATRDLSSTGIR